MKSQSERANGSGDGRALERRDWLTLRQAAAELQVSEALLRRAYYRRELTAYLVSNRIRIHRADLQAWLESQRWSPARCHEHTARPRVVGRKRKHAASPTRGPRPPDTCEAGSPQAEPPKA
jgi:excisionase family DNA binding protein